MPDLHRVIDLEIGGMTCASCAARIEKRLNQIDGVVASVNYATEKANATVPSTISSVRLIETVQAAGYTAAESAPVVLSPPPGSDRVGTSPASRLRHRLILSALLSLPVMVLAMVPAWQFAYWQWLSLGLATPVVLWAGWPFHRAAARNLRHRAATMDTLISVGTLAAYGWSLYALVFGDAGVIGMRHQFSFLTSGRGGAGSDTLYLETAAAVTTFILAGRYLEARAKRRGRRGSAGAGRARGQGRHRAGRGPRAAGTDRRTRCRAGVHRPAGGEDRHRRNGHRRAIGGRRRPGDR